MYQQPEPRQRWIFPLLLYSLILIFVSSFATYALAHGFGPAPTSPGTPALPFSTPTPKPALQSSDFPTFITAFANLFTEPDYGTLQSVVDTQHFQARYMVPSPSPYAPSDPGPYTWQDINQDLVTDQLHFELTIPVLTAEQAGYTCFGYDQTGITSISYGIKAAQIQYVVGTTHVAASEFDPLITPNSTVFVFELLNQTWLLRAITFNNALGC